MGLQFERSVLPEEIYRLLKAFESTFQRVRKQSKRQILSYLLLVLQRALMLRFIGFKDTMGSRRKATGAYIRLLRAIHANVRVYIVGISLALNASELDEANVRGRIVGISLALNASELDEGRDEVAMLLV